MEKNIKEIIAALSSANDSDRYYAVEDLGRIEAQNRIPLLIKALHDPSVRVREAAVEVLTKIGNVIVAGEVVKLLNSENVPVRNAALEILEGTKSPALDPLSDYISSPSADLRKFAIDTIGKLLLQGAEARPKILSALVDCLADPDANVAGSAAEALGSLRRDTTIPFLLSYLEDPKQSTWLHCSCIMALSRISSKLSTEALCKIDKTLLSPETKEYLEMIIGGKAL